MRVQAFNAAHRAADSAAGRELGVFRELRVSALSIDSPGRFKTLSKGRVLRHALIKLPDGASFLNARDPATQHGTAQPIERRERTGIARKRLNLDHHGEREMTATRDAALALNRPAELNFKRADLFVIRGHDQ